MRVARMKVPAQEVLWAVSRPVPAPESPLLNGES
jgi:hypothetical protein